jgi:hypothetical protein
VHAEFAEFAETGVLDALQPVASVVVTEYIPEPVTTIDCVVAPFDHRYDAAALDVSVTLLPGQKVVGPFALIVGVTGVVTVTLTGALVPMQAPSVIVTV